MNFFIRIEGVDGKTSIPLENLLDKGITPKTWVCLDDGTDIWDRAENFKELDTLWNSQPKDKIENLPLANSHDSVALDESNQGQNTEENKLNIEEEKSSKSFILAINRMVIMGIIILIVFFVGRWLIQQISPRNIGSKTETIDISIEQGHLDALLNDGMRAVENGNNYDIAFDKFSKVKELLRNNPTLNHELVDDLAISYQKKGEELCDKYRNTDSKNLFYIPNNYFTYAALLNQKTPKICQ